ncbi:MAG: sulfatase-like hydrolase/transferase [Alcaligenes sp.]
MIRTRLIDLAAVIALGYFQYYLLQGHQDFLFLDESGQYRWLALALSMAPLFALYFLLRVLLPCTVAGALTAGTSLLLTEISNTKQALTTEPLSWTDITRTDNLSVVPHYISQSHIIYALLAIAGIVLLMRLDRTARLTKIGILLAALFSLLSLHPYLNRIDTPLSHVAQFELTRQDINYVVWDWPMNIRKNGLLTHLVQTSQRRMPPKPTTTEREQFDILRKPSAGTSAPPSNIIVILCEACWHDEEHFKEAFRPLEKIGFQAFRAIAPVYGGGTVNSAFELLTGLPANGALNGIIYQEYTELLSSQAWSWPRSLEKAGYASVSLHNHNAAFWNRHIINPKLGFRRFVALEDMEYNGPIWANDEILFKAASQEQQNSDRPNFQFITTVYTHGAYYPRDGDHGEQHYQEKLTQSLSDAADFADRLLADHPDSLILLVGDHKPALTRFFHQENIFSDTFFIRMGDTDQDYMFSPSAPKEILGDVPGYIYYRGQDLAARLNHQPFFCLGQIINDASAGAILPAFQYARHYDLCSSAPKLTYTQRSESYPGWLYSASLFDF